MISGSLVLINAHNEVNQVEIIKLNEASELRINNCCTPEPRLTCGVGEKIVANKCRCAHKLLWQARGYLLAVGNHARTRFLSEVIRKHKFLCSQHLCSHSCPVDCSPIARRDGKYSLSDDVNIRRKEIAIGKSTKRINCSSTSAFRVLATNWFSARRVSRVKEQLSVVTRARQVEALIELITKKKH